MGVVSVYGSFHVWHTAVADFHIVYVEYVEFAGCSWKMHACR